MRELRLRCRNGLVGEAAVPGDKSITHRALLLGALAEGRSRVRGALASRDCLATLACVRAVGVTVVEEEDDTLVIEGRGLRGLSRPSGALDCVRSGTTIRLLAGILAGQRFDTVLTGEPQLLRRPMARVVDPLSAMGAAIESNRGRAPLSICGRPLRGMAHHLGVASAQVKSALLLAGLYAEGETRVVQPARSRDHTERMLAAMGAAVLTDGDAVTVRPASALRPLTVTVPGDLSSAAFPIVAATLVPGSRVVLHDVGMNRTRTGLIDVLRAMGASILEEHVRTEGNEPLADLVVEAAPLRGVEVGGALIPRMIDEFPVLAVAATQAAGRTVVRNATELRVKESDRIAGTVDELRRLGASIEETPDGFVVEGPTDLKGGAVDGLGDHRLAMALAVAGLVAREPVVVRDAECVEDSFPGFAALICALGAADE